jgi:hypothetical protein
MSHDILSPLSSIISVANGHSGLEPKEAHRLVGSILRYILEFLNCLLVVALQHEATGSSIKMFHEYFNIKELLEKIRKMMSPLANQKQTSILVEGNSKDLLMADKPN